MPRGGRPLTAADRSLVQAAEELLRRRYVAKRHTVASAVRTRSGSVYVGVNLNGIHSPCAEPVALGAAVTAGDRAFETMVAVQRRGTEPRYRVLSPCGNCRQLLYDYAPDASILVSFRGGRLARLSVTEGLPGAYATFEEERHPAKRPRRPER